MLDTPRKTFSPLKTLEKLSTPRTSGPEAMKTYSTALNSAEVRYGGPHCMPWTLGVHVPAVAGQVQVQRTGWVCSCILGRAWPRTGGE